MSVGRVDQPESESWWSTNNVRETRAEMAECLTGTRSVDRDLFLSAALYLLYPGKVRESAHPSRGSRSIKNSPV